MAEKAYINQSEITLIKGDITDQETDAIVNAANAFLQLGAGVAGAIREKGGPDIQKECDKIGGTPAGTAAITTGGLLKARWVIHAVGPRKGEGNEENKLSGATSNALRIAAERGLSSITFPAISTGIYGFPVDRCASIMLSVVAAFLRKSTQIREVRFCLWDDETYSVFQSKLQEMMQAAEEGRIQ